MYVLFLVPHRDECLHLRRCVDMCAHSMCILFTFHILQHAVADAFIRVSLADLIVARYGWPFFSLRAPLTISFPFLSITMRRSLLVSNIK